MKNTISTSDAEEILRIVRECEEFQKDSGSDYARLSAKVAAYKHIKELVMGDSEA